MRFIASFVALLIAGMAAASPVASDTTATVRSDQSVGLVLSGGGAKGIAHIGIGEAKGDDKALEAVQQAVSSPLLETTIEGASHVIINISGDISLMDANDAASYVQNLAGEDANIIFGAMYDLSLIHI